MLTFISIYISAVPATTFFFLPGRVFSLSYYIAQITAVGESL